MRSLVRVLSVIAGIVGGRFVLRRVTKGRPLPPLPWPLPSPFKWRPFPFFPESDWLERLLCALLPGRCSQVRVVGPLRKVRPDQPFASGTGATGAILLAARNEFESFQVVIKAGRTALQNVAVRLSTPLAGVGGTIPVGNVAIYRVDYYDVKLASDREGGVGRWPDPLVPSVDPWFGQQRNAFPIDVPANETRVAWVDILVPQNATPGSYTGELAVTGAGLQAEVPVELTVFNAALPSTASLKTAFGLGWDDMCHGRYGQGCFAAASEAEGWRLNALCARVALDNRITIASPQYQPLSAANRPLFQQHTLPLLNGTAGTRLPGARLTSFQVDINAAAAWRNEAQAQGFSSRAFAYVCDEPGANAAQWSKCQQVAGNVSQAWPGIPILVTASIAEATQAGATSYLNWIVVLVNNMANKPGYPNAGDQRNTYNSFLNSNASNEVWLYTSCMSHGCEPNAAMRTQCQSAPSGSATSDPYFDGWPGWVIDQPAIQARATGWMAFLYRTSGELYFQVSHCFETAWSAQYAYGGNGDGTLFYPGDPARIGGKDWIPLESVRLKLIRDGYEDYEYLKILADQGKAPQAYDIAKQLFPKMYSTASTEEDLYAARRSLARLIDPVNVTP